MSVFVSRYTAELELNSRIKPRFLHIQLPSKRQVLKVDKENPIQQMRQKYIK